MKQRQTLILLLLILVLLVPALHKLSGEFPPEWFEAKFQNTFIGKVPSGLILSYGFIVALEIIGPLLLTISLIQRFLKKDSEKLRALGFTVYYILFIILTFGSFLVQDYDNGFQDFMYFIGIALLEGIFFLETTNNSETTKE